MKIKDLPVYLRPREKALMNGIDSLSDYELLALLIGSGIKNKSAVEMAQDLLNKHCSLESLVQVDLKELSSNSGFNKIKSLTLLASFELIKRVNKEKNRSLKKINTSHSLYMKYQDYYYHLNQEKVVVVLLNNMNFIINERLLYVGSISSSTVSISEIVKYVENYNAKKFYFMHNHPSGNPSPSEEDILFSAILKKASDNHKIMFMDHLIISEGTYFSFKEHGLL